MRHPIALQKTALTPHKEARWSEAATHFESEVTVRGVQKCVAPVDHGATEQVTGLDVDESIVVPGHRRAEQAQHPNEEVDGPEHTGSGLCHS